MIVLALSTVFSLYLSLLLVVAVAATASGRTAPALRRVEGAPSTMALSPRLMLLAASFLLFTVLGVGGAWLDRELA